jgi:hypothetical protein
MEGRTRHKAVLTTPTWRAFALAIVLTALTELHPNERVIMLSAQATDLAACELRKQAIEAVVILPSYRLAMSSFNIQHQFSTKR